jgi:cytochrome c biogenesis protein CcmG/thiol:disulfide interchange protein DsbE
MTDTIQTTPISDAAADPIAAPQEAKRQIRWTSVAIWLVVFGLLAVLGWGLLNANATRPEAGAPAPDFTVEFFDGYEWQGMSSAALADMRGNPVVLNFWASWCVECRLESDAMEAAWQKYRDEGVVFLGVAYSDVEPNSIRYMNEFNLTYPHGPDLGTDISQTYEITGVPETFFIDRDGTITHVQIGPLDASTLDSLIQRMLAQ